jgi:hypothetical protein
VAQLADWRTQQRLQNVAKTLRRSAMSTSEPSHLDRLAEWQRRLDRPEHQLEKMHLPGVNQEPAPAEHVKRRRVLRVHGQITTWMLVVTGLVVGFFGLGLGGWSLLEGETVFWQAALVATLFGQGLVVFGLALLVARLWTSSRQANGRLLEAHVKLAKLDRAAESLLGQHHATAAAFYGELVRGASPQMLAANLQGQLDQLSGSLVDR